MNGPGLWPQHRSASSFYSPGMRRKSVNKGKVHLRASGRTARPLAHLVPFLAPASRPRSRDRASGPAGSLPLYSTPRITRNNQMNHRRTRLRELQLLQRNSGLPPPEQPLHALRVQPEHRVAVPLRIFVPAVRKAGMRTGRPSRRKRRALTHLLTCLASSTPRRG